MNSKGSSDEGCERNSCNLLARRIDTWSWSASSPSPKIATTSCNCRCRNRTVLACAARWKCLSPTIVASSTRDRLSNGLSGKQFSLATTAWIEDEVGGSSRSTVSKLPMIAAHAVSPPSFSSTDCSARRSFCCWMFVVRSPRVRSVTPRTRSVVRLRFPVIASGKSMVTSRP